MNETTLDLLSLKDEINCCKENLIYLLEISKQNEKLLNDKNKNSQGNELNSIKQEINSIKQEINVVKEINNKTVDFLLLEIESNLDKQKQSQALFNSQIDLSKLDKFNKDNLIKGNDSNFFVEGSDKTSDVITDSFMHRDKELNEYWSVIFSKDKEILDANVDLLNRLSKINDYEDFIKTIDFLNNQLIILNNELKEKDDTISSLKDEIFILNSIIDEKDNTIGSLRSLKND